MIAVLDPAFFSASGDEPAEEGRVRGDVAAALAFLRATGAELVQVDPYWVPLWAELIRPLTIRWPGLRSDFGTLRRAAVRRPLAPCPEGPHVWGFGPMFDRPDLGLGPEWAQRMAVSVVRLHLATGRPVVLFTRPVVGRNLIRRRAGHSTIDEVGRWRLYIQPRTPQAVAIPCVWDGRQVAVPWTARFDPRLPGEPDGARYPFCPPARWWKRDVTAVRTHTGKPAFIDARGCGWARPNIPLGAGYHWDVFLSDTQRAEAVGVDQVNIVESGAPSTEGRAGDIHHTPSDKQSKLVDCGWSC